MSAGWQRVALAFFRVHALTPLAGLAVLHATALFFLLRSGSLPSRPSFDPSSLSFSGGPSVPESLQQILFPAALAWSQRFRWEAAADTTARVVEAAVARHRL